MQVTPCLTNTVNYHYSGLTNIAPSFIVSNFDTIRIVCVIHHSLTNLNCVILLLPWRR